MLLLRETDDWGEGHVLSLQETEHREFVPGMVAHVVPTLRLVGSRAMASPAPCW